MHLGTLKADKALRWIRYQTMKALPIKSVAVTYLQNRDREGHPDVDSQKKHTEVCLSVCSKLLCKHTAP